ncbi:MAG: dihydroneopterin aldolase [Bacteroidetes bacterium]|nr:dihydroneopterin aldolase [Bacteroidota bacterium]
MGKLFVEGMKFHAFHGCNPDEAKTGGDYLVDVTVDTDFTKPSSSDKLSDAVDYVAIYNITKKEMSVRSNLIEHVAQRIHDSLRKKFPSVNKIKVKVVKINPPVGGEAKSVSAVISK